MRKVFLDNLPRWETGVNKDKVNWEKSIGYKIKFIYDDVKGYIKIIDYKKNKKAYLIIKYNNNEFEIKTDYLQKCHIRKILSPTTKGFKIGIGIQIKDDKRDLIVVDRKCIKDKWGSNRKYYKYKCNKCGYDKGWILERHLVHDNIGCSCCDCKAVVEGINDIPTTASWMVKYFQNGYNEAKLYTYSSDKKIYPICPDCGRVKDKAISICNIYRKHSIGCSCSDGKSYISKYMFNLLEQLKKDNQITDFNTEIKYDWCNFFNIYKNKKSFGIYDFVIEDKKIIIETDGGFHRMDNNLSGQTKEESQFIDDIKDKMANEHGYQVIRISDENDIKQNITNSKINNIFDLDKIDWLKCKKFAVSNRVKEACKLKRLNYKYTSMDIGKIMKLSESTIRKYLKQGTNLGWCNYVFENHFGKQYMRKNGIPIICLNSKKVFSSIVEAEEKMGFVKRHSKISEVCKGIRKFYGVDTITKEYLQWQYYNDYLISPKQVLTNKEIDNLILQEHTLNKFIIKTIICLNNKKNNIITEESLNWIYYNDYIKLNNINLIHNK